MNYSDGNPWPFRENSGEVSIWRLKNEFKSEKGVAWLDNKKNLNKHDAKVDPAVAFRKIIPSNQLCQD